MQHSWKKLAVTALLGALFAVLALFFPISPGLQKDIRCTIETTLGEPGPDCGAKTTTP